MVISDRLLLGPGPSNPYPEAVAALGRPMLGHMDPEFLAIMDETMARAKLGDMFVYVMNEQRGASNAKAKRELDWRPLLPSWQDGFAELYANN